MTPQCCKPELMKHFVMTRFLKWMEETLRRGIDRLSERLSLLYVTHGPKNTSEVIVLLITKV
jgi:hypothetical protein